MQLCIFSYNECPPPFGHSPGHLLGKKVAKNEKRKKKIPICANFEAHLS